MDENKKGSITPMKKPISTWGFKRFKSKVKFRLPSTVLLKAAIRVIAVSAAEPMAKPLPVAAVVLPRLSRASVL